MSALSPAVVLMFVTATCTGIAAVYDDSKGGRHNATNRLFVDLLGTQSNAPSSPKCQHCHLAPNVTNAVAFVSPSLPLP